MTESYPDRPTSHEPARMDEGQERFWAMLAHISAPIAAIISAGSLSILGPLIIWFIVRDRSPLARNAAAGAFNFNLSFWLLYLVGWVLVFTVIGIPIALLIWGVIFVVSFIAHLVGAMRGFRGKYFDYPFQLPVLS